MNVSHEMTLFQHQRVFVDEVAAMDRGVAVVTAPPGSGKTTALVASAARVLADRPDSHVLFLVPPIVVPQIAVRARAQGSPADVIDRYRFRELLDRDSTSRAATTSMWPANCVCVMSLDLAGMPDVLAALSAGCWDLLVVDEAQLLRGRRVEAVKRIMGAARLVVFGSAVADPADGQLELVDARHFDWAPDAAAVSGGRARGATAPPVRRLTYRPTREEQELGESVRELADNLGLQHGWVSELVRRSGESSPAALLVTMQALEEGLGPEDGVPTAAELLVDAPADDEQDGWMNATLPPETREAIAAVVEKAGSLEADAKVQALLGELQGVASSARVCVLVEYGATLSYLETCLEDQGRRAVAVHRGLSPETQRASLETFDADGHVLLATWAILRAGMEPRSVDHLIFYDTPRSDADRDELVSSVRPLGASGELSVVTLVKVEE